MILVTHSISPLLRLLENALNFIALSNDSTCVSVY